MLMRKTFRNILDGKVPEAFPKPATEEPDGPNTRINYSFDSLVRVKALQDGQADFKILGLGQDMAKAAIEVAESTDDQGLRDQKNQGGHQSGGSGLSGETVSGIGADLDLKRCEASLSALPGPIRRPLPRRLP